MAVLTLRSVLLGVALLALAQLAALPLLLTRLRAADARLAALERHSAQRAAALGRRVDAQQRDWRAALAELRSAATAPPTRDTRVATLAAEASGLRERVAAAERAVAALQAERVRTVDDDDALPHEATLVADDARRDEDAAGAPDSAIDVVDYAKAAADHALLDAVSAEHARLFADDGKRAPHARSYAHVGRPLVLGAHDDEASDNSDEQASDNSDEQATDGEPAPPSVHQPLIDAEEALILHGDLVDGNADGGGWSGHVDVSFVVPILGENADDNRETVHATLETIEEVLEMSSALFDKERDARLKQGKRDALLTVEVLFVRRRPHDEVEADDDVQMLNTELFHLRVRATGWAPDIDGDSELSFESALNKGAFDADGDVLIMWSPDLEVRGSMSDGFLTDVFELLLVERADVGVLGATLLEASDDYFDDESIVMGLASSVVLCGGIDFGVERDPHADASADAHPTAVMPHCDARGLRYPLPDTFKRSRRRTLAVAIAPLAVRRDVFEESDGFVEGGGPFLSAVEFSLRALKRTRDAASPVHNYVSNAAFELLDEELRDDIVDFRRHHRDLLHKFVGRHVELVSERKQAEQALSVSIMWDTYSGCTGFNIEAATYIAALEPAIFGGVHVAAGTAADAGERFWCSGWPAAINDTLQRAASVEPSLIDVWVSHKPPASYPEFPYEGNVFYGPRPRIVVGRSMYEASDIVPSAWRGYAARVDEIWVPTRAARRAFLASGFESAKLRVVPESINLDLYNPRVTQKEPAWSERFQNTDKVVGQRFLVSSFVSGVIFS